MTSNRQKKKIVQEGMRKLKSDPSWDAKNFTPADPMEKLRALDQQDRGDEVYGESTRCTECQQLRESTSDETALCDTHLAQAMGF